MRDFKQVQRNLLSTIFSHGVRWELVERNPACGQGGTPGHRGASTGVRQSNRISITRVVLPPDVVRETLEQLALREATMALIDAVTALRASELIALKWKNVGWDTGILQSEFAWVGAELKETKSGSNALPLAQSILKVLRLWREHTPYRADEDWIFASPHYHGKTPYTYQILFRRHILPVIERVSGLKSSKEAPIGWHAAPVASHTAHLEWGECEGHAIATATHHSQDNPRTLRTSCFCRSTKGPQEGRQNGAQVLPLKFPEKLKARSTTASV